MRCHASPRRSLFGALGSAMLVMLSLAVATLGCAPQPPPAGAGGQASSSPATETKPTTSQQQRTIDTAPRRAKPSRCDALRATHERAFADAGYAGCTTAQRPQPWLVDVTFGCVETPAGVVAYMATDVKVLASSNAGPCPLLALELRRHHPTRPEPGLSELQIPTDWSRDEVLSRHPRLVGAFDFDDDGSPELLLESYAGDAYLFGVPTFSVEGAQGPYSRAPRYSQDDPGPSEVRIAKIEDVDHDGRPDLILRSPFFAEWGAVDQPRRPFRELVHVPLLAHSRPDGTFSESDDASQAYARRACPRRPASLGASVASQAERIATGKRIACMRLWGASSAEVLAKLRPTCRRYAADELEDEAVERGAHSYAAGECPSWWKRWATAKLPLALTEPAAP